MALDVLSIRGREIGRTHTPYVIAEIGSNHNGDMELCKDLINAAKESGADAVKFQSWSESSLISRTELDRNKQYADQHRHFGSLREMIRAYQLTPDQHTEIAAYCASISIPFISSAFSPAEVQLLTALDVPAIKIASMDVNHPLLIRAAAASGLPVILSTGMATLAEVATAVDCLRDAGATSYALLHCVSIYPTPPEKLNLRNLSTLYRLFSCPVGFSDHSMGISAAIAAVALGACIIEKHFTLDRSLPGWDHWMSATPHELQQLCAEVRAAHQTLGSEMRTVTKEEERKRLAFRRRIVLRRAVKAGEQLTLDELDFKRPGTGIHPSEYVYVIGRTTARALPADHELEWSDLT